MGEVRDLKDLKDKLEDAKRRQDVAVLQQVLEPLTEAVEELSVALQAAKTEKNPEPFTGKNIADSLEKLIPLIQKFKPQNIDLSPISNIVSELNNTNKNILVAIGKISSQPNDSDKTKLMQMITDLIQKQNDFMSKGMDKKDYSVQLTAISTALNNKPNEEKKPLKLEFELIRQQGGSVQKVIVTQK